MSFSKNKEKERTMSQINCLEVVEPRLDDGVIRLRKSVEDINIKLYRSMIYISINFIGDVVYSSFKEVMLRFQSGKEICLVPVYISPNFRAAQDLCWHSEESVKVFYNSSWKPQSINGSEKKQIKLIFESKKILCLHLNHDDFNNLMTFLLLK